VTTSIILEKDGVPVGSIKSLWISKDQRRFEADLIRFNRLRFNDVFKRGMIISPCNQKVPLSIKIGNDVIMSSVKGCDTFDNLWFTEINATQYRSGDFVIIGTCGPLYTKDGIIRLEKYDQ